MKEVMTNRTIVDVEIGTARRPAVRKLKLLGCLFVGHRYNGMTMEFVDANITLCMVQCTRCQLASIALERTGKEHGRPTQQKEIRTDVG